MPNSHEMPSPEEGGEKKRVTADELEKEISAKHTRKAGPLGREALFQSTDAVREVHEWALEKFNAKGGVVILGDKEWAEIDRKLDEVIRRWQEKK